jgi:hypothetical protein
MDGGGCIGMVPMSLYKFWLSCKFGLAACAASLAANCDDSTGR